MIQHQANPKLSVDSVIVVEQPKESESPVILQIKLSSKEPQTFVSSLWGKHLRISSVSLNEDGATLDIVEVGNADN